VSGNNLLHRIGHGGIDGKKTEHLLSSPGRIGEAHMTNGQRGGKKHAPQGRRKRRFKGRSSLSLTRGGGKNRDFA